MGMEESEMQDGFSERQARLKKRIERYDVISFDVFDTLLTRPYARPTDLFRHLEYAENEPGFAARRIDAERRARFRCENGEARFDEIYGSPGFETKIPPEREIELERRVLRPNPEMKALYDHARRLGKKIVLVTDMYHRAETIASFLDACGYGGWSGIYVSSEYRLSKSRTGLYRRMLADIGVSPGRVLHFGDRWRADFFAPKLLGIDTIRVPRTLERWLAAHKSEKKFWRNGRDSLAASLFVGLAARRAVERHGDTEDDYWREIGYTLCGPVCFGYDKFIEADCEKRGIGDLLFVARDGWTLQKIFELFGNEKIRSSYLYAPRFMTHVAKLTTESGSAAEYRELFEFYARDNEELRRVVSEPFDSVSNAKEFLQSHRTLFEPWREQYERRIGDYIRDKLRHMGEVGLVDTLTRLFSSQRLVASVLGDRLVRGYYWVVRQTDGLERSFAFSLYSGMGTNQWSDKSVFTRRWDFMEFLLTSPEPPVTMISSDGRPIYKADVRPEETLRGERYEKIAEGALDFARDMLDVLQHTPIPLPSEELTAKVNAFLDFPSAFDKKMFRDVYCAMDSKHSVYRPMLLYRPTWKEILSLKCFSLEYLKTVALTPWRTPFQSILAFLIRPAMALYLRRYFNKCRTNDSETPSIPPK